MPAGRSVASTSAPASSSSLVRCASPTIADCALVPQVVYFTRGVADYVPKDCLDKFPTIKAYLDAFYAEPRIKAYYDGLEK